MKENILKLRADGKSYNEIRKILGCSKGTIAYHCGFGQKEKLKSRVKNYKKTLPGILKRKKDNFSFSNGKRVGRGRRVHLAFSLRDFVKKLQLNSKCYLTGRKIDLYQPKTYQCDHIIPVSKGGKSTLDNLGLVCRDANMSKSDMTVDEFFSLCKEILTNNGFKVEKI